MQPDASWVVVAGMVAVPLTLGCGWVLAARRAYGAGVTGRAVAGVTAWLVITLGLAASGVLARFDARPPPLVLLLMAVLGTAVALSVSPVGKALALRLPVAALVGFQGFRLPLELVMHQAAREGVMPPQMSFDGYNFDILSGVTALLTAAWCARGQGHRVVLWVWNLLGLALLFNVVAISVASTPLLQAFGTDPRLVNTWVAYPPFVWLPTVMVLSALTGHLVLTRRLLMRV